MRVLLAIFCLALIAVGCENIVPADDLPYVDHIVIEGYLYAGEPIDSVAITHTLPLSNEYDKEAAALKTAVVVVSVDGRSIPLAYARNGIFKDPNREVIQSGKEYSIDVRWNGLHAWASTHIPVPPSIVSQAVNNIGFDTSIYRTYYGGLDTSITFGGVLKMGIRPVSGVAFGVMNDSITSVDGSTFYGSRNYYGYDYSMLHRGDQQDSVGVISLAQDIYLSPFVNQYRAYVLIGAIDEAYYDFLRMYRNYDDNSVFGTAGTNPKWNVKGDGIGLFIGMAETRTSFLFEW
jgi:hypothetical protein